MNTRIKEIRKDSRLTQEEFGKRIGITNAAVSRIESGIYAATEMTIISICREFSVFREWLETGEGPKYKTRPSGGLRQEVAALYGHDDEYAVDTLTALLALPPEWFAAFKAEWDRIQSEKEDSK